MVTVPARAGAPGVTIFTVVTDPQLRPAPGVTMLGGCRSIASLVELCGHWSRSTLWFTRSARYWGLFVVGIAIFLGIFELCPFFGRVIPYFGNMPALFVVVVYMDDDIDHQIEQAPYDAVWQCPALAVLQYHGGKPLEG